MTPIPSIAARRDANEPSILDTFKKHGCSVSQKCALDAAIADNGYTFMVEIKDGSLSPSRQRLTWAEAQFIQVWKGDVFIVRFVEDVYHVLHQFAGCCQRCTEMEDEIEYIREHPIEQLVAEKLVKPK